jgi:intracellular sulfur oxidation DsrE/DsrF family protein
MDDKEYKVVFQLSTNDEQVCKSMIKQVGNIRKEIPAIKVEIVTHGLGVELLYSDSRLSNVLQEMADRRIVLLACSNSLNERGKLSSGLISVARIIPSALAHLIVRQSDGWSYIKAGF